jgi:uncharacterized phage protein (TIGR02218 family)
MKGASAGFISHLTERQTSLATCWRVQRLDGAIYAFTDLDRDITISGTTYAAATGFQRAAIASASNLSVDETELIGFVDGATVTAIDLDAGRWDGASVRIFVVNWSDPAHLDVKMRKGVLGEASILDNGTWRAEIRGLAQWLQQTIGELYSPECRADLGDGRCRLPIRPGLIARSTAYAAGTFVRVETDVAASGSYREERRIYECTTAGTTAGSAPTFDETPGNTTADGTAVFTAREAMTRAYTVASSANRETLVLTADDGALAGYTDARFTGGVAVIETGANAGISREVLAYSAGTRTVQLFTPLPFSLQPGDVLRLQPGCDKRYDTCIGFGNRLNFRGEPFVPGVASLIQTPIA